MFGLIGGFVLKLLSGGMLDKVLDAANKRADSATERERIASEIVKAQIGAEVARRNAQKDVAIAGMSHWVWWLGWALFVVPVGIYHAAIFLVSTFGLDIVILRVPPVQEEWGWQIVQSIFIAQAATGVTATAIKAFARK